MDPTSGTFFHLSVRWSVPSISSLPNGSKTAEKVDLNLLVAWLVFAEFIVFDSEAPNGSIFTCSVVRSGARLPKDVDILHCSNGDCFVELDMLWFMALLSLIKKKV